MKKQGLLFDFVQRTNLPVLSSPFTKLGHGKSTSLLLHYPAGFFQRNFFSCLHLAKINAREFYLNLGFLRMKAHFIYGKA